MNCVLALALLLPQAAPPPDQKRVDEAIRKGVEFLKGSGSPSAYGAADPWHVPDSDELILLTLVVGGCSEKDPVVQKYLKKSLEGPLHKTYKVATQAVALEEIDRVAYQGRIAQCAQHLVDNQCTNGQWSYGEPTAAVKGIPTGAPKKDEATAGGIKEFGTPPPSSAPKDKPRVTKKIVIRQTRTGDASGDNSNAQYAALGLRAAHDSGVVIPSATLALARRWWETVLVMDGDEKKGAVSTGGAPSMPPGGWGYRMQHNKEPYASMTAGATGALVMYDYIAGRDWKKDKLVGVGMAWMGKHFSVTANTGGPSHGGEGPTGWLYYYLYALERLGILYGTERIGAHDWYAEGAKVILEAQKPDGSWEVSSYKNAVWDTCFAVLFLKKATRPLVASEDAKK
jgi:hypothetical protein